LKTDTAVAVHWQGKFRGADFTPLSFSLKTVALDTLRDSKGRLIPTVIAQHISAEAEEAIEAAARRDSETVLKALAESKTPMSHAEVARAAGWYTQKNEPNRSKAQRVLRHLKKNKLVEITHGQHSLTVKGKRVAKNA
jgi:hypothetical protein